MEEFTIRPYTKYDKVKVLDIFKMNVPKYFAESEIEDLIEYLENKIEKYFVVEHKKEIVGAGGINFNHSEQLGIISWDYLHPEYQGKKIGSKLLQFRINYMLNILKYDKIIVNTSQLAYKFYENNGFKLNEIKKDFWAEGFDLYHMIYQKKKAS